MRIKTIELFNYRPYKGLNTVEFEEDDIKNFTIIQGINGAGKSNLINAITWCLYEIEEHLKEEAKEKMLPLINLSALEEIKNGERVGAYIKIVIDSDEEAFQITREIFGGKRANGEIYIDVDSKPLQVMYLQKGKRDWYQSPNPKFMVNRILPKDVRNFFFLDGEQLRQFFSNTKQNVENAILDVSQISVLEEASERVNKLKRGINAEMGEEMPELNKISNEIEKLTTLEKSATKHIKDLNKEVKELDNEIDKLGKQLSESGKDKVAGLQKEREEIQTRIKRNNGEYKRLIEEIRDQLITHGPAIYLAETIEKTLDIAEQLEKKGEIPPLIDPRGVQRILKTNKCICGTDVKSGEKRDRIQKLLTLYKLGPIATQIIEGRTRLSIKDHDATNFISSINKKYHRLTEVEDDTRDVNKRLKEISDDILGLEGIEDLTRKLEIEIRKKKGERDSKQMEIGKYQGEKLRLENDLKKKEKEQTTVAKAKGKYDELIKKKEFCQNAENVLETVRSTLIEKIRERIESNTKKYFFELVTEKKGIYKDVKILDNYEISVLHKSGYEAIGTLSAGESLLLALSFVSALRDESGFKAPVFIDTPLGKISAEYRNNVSKLLPEFLKRIQVCLLVTDTEYTDDVKRVLKKHVSKECKLEFDRKTGITKVCDLDGK